MKYLLTILLRNDREGIPERFYLEFEQEIAVINMRRIRVMLVFAVVACAGLLYGINVLNVLHLSYEDNRKVFWMHGLLFFLTATMLVFVLARPLRSPQDFTPYHRRLMSIFTIMVALAPQPLIYAIITTEGHPIFFFAAVLIWYSSLLVPLRTSALVFMLLLLGLWTQLFMFFSPQASAAASGGNTQFPVIAFIFSAVAAITLLISSTFLFRSTVEGFCQRKAVEEERNRVTELNIELGAAYLEADTMNQELKYRQEILEDQATEIEIINTKLHEQNEVLSRLNEEKNEILGIVSHDLKNPISALRGLAEILEQESLNEEQKSEIIRHIASNADRMLELVKNLLDMNQLESGVRQFRRIEFDIVPFITNALKEYHIAAQAKNIHCVFSPEAASILVYADEQAVMQVLDNLISNAIKYSPLGKNVHLCVKSSQNTVRVEVKDEGQGVSPEDMKKLFGKFTRLSARPTGGEHSTGLGLSIVKKMVEAMNGRVWCESEVGDGLPTGATFIVELPKA